MIKIAYNNNSVISVKTYKFGSYLKYAHVHIGSKPNWGLLNENNYYKVAIDPAYDPVMQYLGAYEIVENEAVRKAIDKQFGSVEEEKQKKIKQIKEQCYNNLVPTDPYVWRKFERGKEIPEEIQAERANYLAECDRKEAKVLTLTELREVIAYEF